MLFETMNRFELSELKPQFFEIQIRGPEPGSVNLCILYTI